VTGVIKLVLALQNRLLPKSLHAEDPTPHVDWSAGTVRLLNEARAWEAQGRPRRGAVSSFGISGTNAHVILEEWPEVGEVEQTSSVTDQNLPFLISARSEAALRAQAERLHAHLEAHPEQALLDVAHSLATTRSPFEVRAAVVTRERTRLLKALAQLSAGEPGVALQGQARLANGLALLFTGQGSQQLRMGYGLYHGIPEFKTALDAVFDAMRGLLPRPLREVMFAEPSAEAEALLARTEYTQPALFALEVALYRTLEAWGVRPKYLLGHSVGELAAAHVAQVMTLADACRVVAARGRLMQALPSGGAMLAIEASESELRPWLSELSAVSLAALNGARSVVISGVESAVLKVKSAFEAQGRKTRRLEVSHAFHSAQMDGMLSEYERVLSGVQLRPARLAIVSNVTGELAPPELFASPAYWVKQVREAVRFEPGLRCLQAAGASGYLELGPQGVLTALAQEALAAAADGGETRSPAWASLRKDRDERESWLSALCGVHVSGHRVDWKVVFNTLGGRRVGLPTYAFQRERYWLQRERSGDVSALGLSALGHPLLGASVSLAEGDSTVLSGQLSLADLPWLAQHVVFGSVIVPGTGLLELALVAAQRVGLDAVVELTLENPLVLQPNHGTQLQVLIGSLDEQGCRSLSIYARVADRAWTRHARGLLGEAQSAAPCELSVWPPEACEELAHEGLYEALEAAGLAYGELFRGLRRVYRRGQELFVEVALAEGASQDAERYSLHPALFDAALHAIGLTHEGTAPLLPFVWQGVSVATGGASALRVRLLINAPDDVSLSLADGYGQPIAEVASLRLRAASAAQLRGSDRADASLYVPEWLPLTAAEASALDWTLLGADGLGLGSPSGSFGDLSLLPRAGDVRRG
jgi:acyl transferase domain-containing protein